MGCPKNIAKYKFLFWDYEVELDHDWELIKVDKPDILWSLTYHCKICSCNEVRNFLSDEDILRRFGFIFIVDSGKTLYSKEIKKQIEPNS